MSRQLGLPPVLFLDRPGRSQTERAQSLRIRRHLGIRDFDRHVAADLRDWLRPGAIEGRTTNELMARAEDRLREWRVMLPASSTLERLVTAEVTQATTNLYGKISSRLPPALREAIDLLVEVPEGDARSSLFRLKDYPKSASAGVIKGDIVRLRLIWRTEKPSASQARELDRMEKQNQQLRGVTAEVLALASELRKGTIERVLGMSDLELGLQYLLGRQSSDRG